MESGSTRVTLLTFAAPPDDGDAAPPYDHLVLVEDKWPMLDRGRGSLGQKNPTLTSIYEVTVMKITSARGAYRQNALCGHSRWL